MFLYSNLDLRRPKATEHSSKRHLSPTTMSTLLPSSQALGDTLIQRVMSLMTVPFDKLAESDASERLELGARRCKEALSSTPWYARGAAQAAERGKEPDYWKNLWQQHCNLVHPPAKSSTPEVLTSSPTSRSSQTEASTPSPLPNPANPLSRTNRLSDSEIDSLRSEMRRSAEWAKAQCKRAANPS